MQTFLGHLKRPPARHSFLIWPGEHIIPPNELPRPEMPTLTSLATPLTPHCASI